VEGACVSKSHVCFTYPGLTSPSANALTNTVFHPRTALKESADTGTCPDGPSRPSFVNFGNGSRVPPPVAFSLAEYSYVVPTRFDVNVKKAPVLFTAYAGLVTNRGSGNTLIVNVYLSGAGSTEPLYTPRTRKLCSPCDE
jgi:hypothetical protein